MPALICICFEDKFLERFDTSISGWIQGAPRKHRHAPQVSVSFSSFLAIFYRVGLTSMAGFIP